MNTIIIFLGLGFVAVAIFYCAWQVGFNDGSKAMRNEMHEQYRSWTEKTRISMIEEGMRLGLKKAEKNSQRFLSFKDKVLNIINERLENEKAIQSNGRKRR